MTVSRVRVHHFSVAVCLLGTQTHICPCLCLKLQKGNNSTGSWLAVSTPIMWEPFRDVLMEFKQQSLAKFQRCGDVTMAFCDGVNTLVSRLGSWDFSGEGVLLCHIHGFRRREHVFQTVLFLRKADRISNCTSEYCGANLFLLHLCYHRFHILRPFFQVCVICSPAGNTTPWKLPCGQVQNRNEVH